MEEFFSELLHLTTRGIETTGVLVVLAGVLLAAANFSDHLPWWKRSEES